MEKSVKFGFATVDENAKQGMVNKVFEKVSSRYDIMNDAMSLGLHRAWKRRMVEQLNLRQNLRMLDLAGGTGDISLLSKQKEPTVEITICDINPAMLEEGKKRLTDKNIINGVSWTCGNAEKLSFPNNYFDRVSIAFGIRNVTHIDAALAEIHRVLKPGGKFVCLEFSTLAIPLLAPLYDTYSFKIIPKLGKLIAGDEDSYRYLVESIRNFPAQEKFTKMIIGAGFTLVKYRNLNGGIVAIHSGIKI